MSNHPFIKAVKIMKITAAAGAILLLNACGRTLPSIDENTLAQKRSMLVITGQSLPEEEFQLIEAAAREHARKNNIALEFAGRQASLTPELSNAIKGKPFNGIVAAGDELLGKLIPLAESEASKRFVLLGSGLNSPGAVNAELPDNVFVKKLDESKKTMLWEEWVQLQKVSGFNVLWISATNYPVPTQWAPSEEADRLVNLDIYPDANSWAAQISVQAKAIQANWIAIYAPLDKPTLDRIRSLRIPVVDLTSGLSAKYSWQTIMPNSMSAALSPDWKGGTVFYNEDEITLTRK